jgi:hypothetical protein
MGRRNALRLSLGVLLLLAGGCASDEEAGEGRVTQEAVGDCTVSLQCASGQTISCSGTNNQCSVGASAVTCNGVSTSCFASCEWNGVTYNHNAFLSAQCSARISGVCRSGPFEGDPCGANGECTARCINGAWMHP